MIRWPWRRTPPAIALERQRHRLAYTRPTLYRHCRGCLKPFCIVQAAASEAHADRVARVLKTYYARTDQRLQG